MALFPPNLRHFFSYFQVELYLFVFIFSLAVEDVTVTLLAQDKFCMRRFNSSEICSSLSKLTAADEAEDLLQAKDAILVQVTTFNFYQSLIYTIPVILSSLFLSSWADRHKSSTKTLLSLTALMAALESAGILLCAIYFDSNVDLMLLAFIFFPLVGGSQSLGMAAISYLSATTNSADRVKRFSILELTYIVSHPLGIFIGGLIIQNPVLSEFARRNGQLHNYHQVLAVAVAGKMAAFSYALLVKFKPRPKSGPRTEEEAAAGCSDETAPLLFEAKTNKVNFNLPSRRTKLQKFVSNSTDLFVWRNILESFSVCFQHRPNRSHIFIWLLLLTMSLVTLTNRSVGVLMFQFVQKVYSWDAGTFSTWNSALYISTHLFGLLIVTPILTKLLQISDSTLLILGLISLLSQNFIRGTIINVLAFCISYFFGSITSIIAVAVRTKLSRLAPADEQNRIFGVLTMLETTAPLLGITLYTAIFNSTISTYPGFVFQLSCAILLLPLTFAVYIALKQPILAGGADCAKMTDENNNRSIEDSGSGSSGCIFDSSESKETVIAV